MSSLFLLYILSYYYAGYHMHTEQSEHRTHKHGSYPPVLDVSDEASDQLSSKSE